MGTPSVEDRRVKLSPRGKEIWSNEEIDSVIAQYANRQLRHQIRSHELLVFCDTPQDVQREASRVAAEKLRQTFVKAFDAHTNTHGTAAKTQEDMQMIMVTMRKIMTSRVKRLKARWRRIHDEEKGHQEHPKTDPIDPEAFVMGLVSCE